MEPEMLVTLFGAPTGAFFIRYGLAPLMLPVIAAWQGLRFWVLARAKAVLGVPEGVHGRDSDPIN